MVSGPHVEATLQVAAVAILVVAEVSELD